MFAVNQLRFCDLSVFVRKGLFSVSRKACYLRNPDGFSLISFGSDLQGVTRLFASGPNKQRPTVVWCVLDWIGIGQHMYYRLDGVVCSRDEMKVGNRVFCSLSCCGGSLPTLPAPAPPAAAQPSLITACSGQRLVGTKNRQIQKTWQVFRCWSGRSPDSMPHIFWRYTFPLFIF